MNTQNPDEWSDASFCIDCGAELWPETDRVFATDDEAFICFECAERRGGVFDEKSDRWTVAPSVSGLTDERRPHA